jgi:hypothetical protein
MRTVSALKKAEPGFRVAVDGAEPCNEIGANIMVYEFASINICRK